MELARERASEGREQDWRSRVRRHYRIGPHDRLGVAPKDERYHILSFLTPKERASFASVSRQARDDVRHIESGAGAQERKANAELRDALASLPEAPTNADADVILVRALERAAQNPSTTAIIFPDMGGDQIDFSRRSLAAIRVLAPRITHLDFGDSWFVTYNEDEDEEDEEQINNMFRGFTRLRRAHVPDWAIELIARSSGETMRELEVTVSVVLSHHPVRFPHLTTLILHGHYDQKPGPWDFLDRNPSCRHLIISSRYDTDFAHLFDPIINGTRTHRLEEITVENAQDVPPVFRTALRLFVAASPTIKKLTLLQPNAAPMVYQGAQLQSLNGPA